jgi:hypothetical protein
MSSQMLLRLIDDYMLITTDLDKARHFLNVMNDGYPEYGCVISPEKTMANFYHQLTSSVVTGFDRKGTLLDAEGFKNAE